MVLFKELGVQIGKAEPGLLYYRRFNDWEMSNVGLKVRLSIIHCSEYLASPGVYICLIKICPVETGILLLSVRNRPRKQNKRSHPCKEFQMIHVDHLAPRRGSIKSHCLRLGSALWLYSKEPTIEGANKRITLQWRNLTNIPSPRWSRSVPTVMTHDDSMYPK